MDGELVLVIDDSPTILKVVQLVLSKAGYLVRTAADGEEGVQAAREERPAVILLDFVMPKMNGYQVCRALAESDDLRDVPVILMSAKGDQVGERFVKVMGIVDYITKPFSPDAITAVVDHTVDKYGRKNGEPSGLLPAAEPPPDAPTPADSDDRAPTADEEKSEATSPRLSAEARRRKKRLEALREAVVSAAAGDDLVPDDRLRARLDDETLEQADRETGPWYEPGVVLEGDLEQVPLVEVLSLLAEQAQTGVLHVHRADARVDVHFRKGKVDFGGAIGLSDEFLLGRYLVQLEAISRQDLDLFLQSRGSSSKLIGEQLVKLNYVRAEDLR